MGKPAVVFYVTGHGFGHGARAGEVARALRALRPDVRIVLRTSLAPDFVAEAFPADAERHPVALDVGLVQRHPLRFDLDATLAALDTLAAREEKILADEVAFLREVRPAVGVVDIPPAAVEALDRAGVPAVVVANFSWDWIYRPFAASHPGFARHADRIAAQYARANLLLQPPIVCDLGAFPRRRDIPLVCRRSAMTRAEARAAFELPRDRKIVLLSFGGIGSVTLARGRPYPPHWLFVAAGRVDGAPEPFRPTPIPPGLRYPDLVRAADAVVTKPGYGIFAECTANRAAMAHTDRGPFAEQAVLVAGMDEFLPHVAISRDDFARSDWHEALHALLDRPLQWPEVSLDGATRAAEAILGYLPSAPR